jgi:hypothetical protein
LAGFQIYPYLALKLPGQNAILQAPEVKLAGDINISLQPPLANGSNFYQEEEA